MNGALLAFVFPVLVEIDLNVLRDALKSVIAKIEQVMLFGTQTCASQFDPICWCAQQIRIATHFIKLPPRRRQLTESTLAAIPTFIVGRAESIANHSLETQARAPFLTVRINRRSDDGESKVYVLATDSNSRIRAIGFGVPILIQLVEFDGLVCI